MRKRKKRSPGNWRTSNPSASGSSRFDVSVSVILRRLCGLASAVLVLILASSAPYFLAKEKKKVSRTVTGYVLDEADRGIVDAAVILTDLRTGEKSATVSKEEGRYQFADLEPTHDYQIQAKYKDFASEVRQVSSLDARNRIVLNLKIPLSKQN